MVKRCGKSAPRPWQHGWQAKPRTEQDQIGRRSRTARPKPPGRSLDSASDGGTRGMVVPPKLAVAGAKAPALAQRRRTEFGLRRDCGAFCMSHPSGTTPRAARRVSFTLAFIVALAALSAAGIAQDLVDPRIQAEIHARRTGAPRSAGEVPGHRRPQPPLADHARDATHRWCATWTRSICACS